MHRLSMPAVVGIVLVLASLAVPMRTYASGGTYYVDCSALVNGNGSAASPWDTLDAVNQHGAFGPGDSILLRRGTTCPGHLAPQGSGTGSDPASVIALDTYGSGSRPVLQAGTNEEAIKLFNQQYWHIGDIETSGGLSAGIYLGGDQNGPSALRHIRLTNVSVHDVAGGPDLGASPGGNAAICVCAGYYTSSGFNPQFTDVIVDGALVYNALTMDGVYASGNGVTVRNTTVHDVGRSGIWSGYASSVLIDSNTVYRTGLDPSSGGNIGIWTWSCTSCTIQYNNVWQTTSGDGADGGAFDVDYYSHNTVVQYNYGHDTDGYCVSVFGAGDDETSGAPTTNTVIRYNVCANTGLGPLHHAGFTPEGTFMLETWNGGSISGLQIYNNTIYANPAVPVPVLHEVQDQGSVAYGSAASFFTNNLIYSSTAPMLSLSRSSRLTANHNLYYNPADPTAARTQWSYHGRPLTGLKTWQTQSRQDAASISADPRLASPTYHDVARPTTQIVLGPGSPAIGTGVNVCALQPRTCSMGTNDFLGHALPAGNTHNIGAVEPGA